MLKIPKLSLSGSAIDIKKTLAFGGFAFVVLCNYGLLRALKDGFVVKNMGAEAIGFLKFYFLLPTTILFFLLYTKLSTSFSQKRIFHWTCMSFLVGFVFVFARLFVFTGNKLALETIIHYEELYPRFKWFVRVALNWEYTVFFILAELWGAIIYTLFFFQLANSVYSPQHAKVHYPPIILLGNLSLPAVGSVLSALGGDPRGVILTIIALNVGTILLYKLISKSFKALPVPQENKKLGSSLVKNLQFIFASKRLWLLFLMMVSLGVSLNVVEVFWKGNLSKISQSVEEYVVSMGHVQSVQGLTSIAFVVLSVFMFGKFSWKFSSLFVAIFLFAVGFLFFCFIFWGGDIKMILLLGLAHTIIGKCLKYTLFDPAKEFVYISLDENFRTKGKAMVDLLGGRFGKSGLGALESVVFFIVPAGRFDNTTLFFATVFFCISFIWVKAVIALDKRLPK